MTKTLGLALVTIALLTGNAGIAGTDTKKDSADAAEADKKTTSRSSSINSGKKAAGGGLWINNGPEGGIFALPGPITHVRKN